MPKVLLVDDDEVFCDAVSQMLEALGHQVTTANTLQETSAILAHQRFDNIFLDFMLPDGSGLHLIDTYSGDPDAPFITLITGHPAIKNLMAGLCGPKINYLLKPLTRENLHAALDRNTRPDETHSSRFTRHFGCLLGESEAMHDIYQMIERVSKTSANVMLLGESGVGKEMVAQAIHNASSTGKLLVAANCGAFSRELIGSELFGHEKGAFTGAVARKAGVFEQATGGSLFLDEITEMPIDIQPNLLRVLETGRVTRVGGVKELDVNCRVISATNRTHKDLAESTVLREDLYFRLAVFPITIPPLRVRPGDITLLSEALLDQLNNENGRQFVLSPAQLELLNSYDWPGNVRELRHTLHRAFIMSDPTGSELALPKDLASPFAKSQRASNQLIPGQTIDDVEKELIRVTLEQLEGDKPRAAEMLGISLKTLYNRLNKYEESTTI